MQKYKISNREKMMRKYNIPNTEKTMRKYKSSNPKYRKGSNTKYCDVAALPGLVRRFRCLAAAWNTALHGFALVYKVCTVLSGFALHTLLCTVTAKLFDSLHCVFSNVAKWNTALHGFARNWTALNRFALHSLLCTVLSGFQRLCTAFDGFEQFCTILNGFELLCTVLIYFARLWTDFHCFARFARNTSKCVTCLHSVFSNVPKCNTACAVLHDIISPWVVSLHKTTVFHLPKRFDMLLGAQVIVTLKQLVVEAFLPIYIVHRQKKHQQGQWELNSPVRK